MKISDKFHEGKLTRIITFLVIFARTVFKNFFFQVSIKRGKPSLFSLLSIHVHTFQHTAENNFNA